MKKIMYFAAVAAVLSLASCAKENLNEDAGTGLPVFTATISSGTKTTVDATSGKVAWETTDKITITDASAAVATYKIKSIDGTTGKATFEFESGASLGQGPYTATYGTAPATAQTYAATPCNLYMTAPGTSTNSFTFTVQCGLMEINLTKTGESVKSIAVTGTPTGESETTYTLTCTDEVSIAEKKSFYIALPEGSYNKIVITNSEDKVCTLTAASGIVLENNHIKPVTFGSDKLNFIPAGALKGKFSVSNDGGTTIKQVYFSQGNLVAAIDASGAPTVWKFAAHQYDCLGKGGANKTIGTAAGDVDLFGWSTYAANNNWGIHTKTEAVEGYTDGYFKDWGKNIGDDNTWRTLTLEEWCYLFAYDPNESEFDTSSPRYNLFKNGVTVCDKTNCLIIAPDNWDTSANPLQTSYDETTWATAEAAGLVCLPAAGSREGSSVTDVNNGYYWSSTGISTSYAYYVFFDIDGVIPDNDDDAARYYGSSVRLITECQ